MNTRHHATKSLRAILCHILKEHPDLLPAAISEIRLSISYQISQSLSNICRYGPYAGLKLPDTLSWGEADRAAVLLGLYEQEVLSAIFERRSTTGAFVDIGAGDGIHAIGTLVGGLFQHSYCFEISENGRRAICQNAELNGVEDRVSIYGAAENGFYNSLPEHILSDCLLLIDIEGAEFGLVDEKLFDAFRNAAIIIELHEWVPDARSKIEAITASSEKTHSSKLLTTGSRDLSGIVEIASLDDNLRWLLCSEGRPYRMSWLYFSPRS
jgi:hypothetical protein